MDTQAKVNFAKKICQEANITFFTANKDYEMASTLPIHHQFNRSVIAVHEKYGRGVDIRFDEDSLVIVGFKHSRILADCQMAGRSSRTMGFHRCVLICVDLIQTADIIEVPLNALDFEKLKVGMRIARVMCGRRRLGILRESKMTEAFRSGWLMPLTKLRKFMDNNQTLLRFEAIGRRWHSIN